MMMDIYSETINRIVGSLARYDTVLLDENKFLAVDEKDSSRVIFHNKGKKRFVKIKHLMDLLKHDYPAEEDCRALYEKLIIADVKERYNVKIQNTDIYIGNDYKIECNTWKGVCIVLELLDELKSINALSYWDEEANMLWYYVGENMSDEDIMLEVIKDYDLNIDSQFIPYIDVRDFIKCETNYHITKNGYVFKNIDKNRWGAK